MENILLKLGFDKVSANYYFRGDIGSLLIANNSIISFDPVASFADSNTINSFFNNLLSQAKINHFDAIILFEKSSLNPAEKELYPDYMINIEDPEKEGKFHSFFTQNKEFINANRHLDDIIPYINFKDNCYSLGQLNLDSSGSVSLVSCYDSISFFNLKELDKPTDAIKNIFDEVNYIEDDDSIYHSFNLNSLDNKKFYFTVKTNIEDKKLTQVYNFFNLEGIQNKLDEDYYYDEDETSSESSRLFLSIKTQQSNDSFIMEPTDIEMVKSAIKKIKIKHLFKV